MGRETRKAYDRRRREGYFETIFIGAGIDIGCGDDPVTPDCVHWDLEQGDAQELPGVPANTFDWVYSSHCLEHLADPWRAVHRWWEVLRPGGKLLIVVPDEDLYEQGIWPSRFNSGHRWTFTIHKCRSWSSVSINLSELIASLPNHKVWWSRVCNAAYDFSGGVWDRTSGPAEAHVEVLVEKLASSRHERAAPVVFETAVALETGIVSDEPVTIYTGILGQIGDIIMFSATVRRLRELFPRSQITFAVSSRYREAGELVAGLPYVDRLFVTDLYFEKLDRVAYAPWHLGWPVDLRGEDEVVEQRKHGLVLETRPRHHRHPWWAFDHQVAETAHMVGVPGPIDLRTEICIPEGTVAPSEAVGKIVLHNDPSISGDKTWPWAYVEQIVRQLPPREVVLIGSRGPDVPGTVDLRDRTSLVETAAIIAAAKCYVGIDSGPMWIAASLQAPAVGLYGTRYIPAYRAIYPHNPNAIYLQAEGPMDQISPEAVLDGIRRHLPW